MLNIENWTTINPMFTYLALYSAWIAREKSEALRYIKERRVYNHEFPLPDLPSWFSMYKSRKPVLAYKRLIFNNSDYDNSQIELISTFRKLEKFSKQNPDTQIKLLITAQDLENSIKFWKDLHAALIDEIKAEITKEPLTADLKAKLSKALAENELPIGFYFLVYAPCLLFYGVSPAILYRNAIKRDVPSIEALLKLDPLIIHDPAIGFQIQSVRLYGKANDYERIIAAITKQPTISYKQLSDERKSIKSDHGADILVLARALKIPMEAPEIRDLYNLLAQDLDGTFTDSDIKKPDGFDKTLRTKATARQKQLQPAENQI